MTFVSKPDDLDNPNIPANPCAPGHNLSGGFAQSVALARVFLRQDAQIVILVVSRQSY